MNGTNQSDINSVSHTNPSENMPPWNYLLLDDDALLKQCDINIYKSSGPGGQHRNKVSSAVRLYHRPTGISAHGTSSRSQHENKREALKNLRIKIATQARSDIDPDGQLPEVVESCLVSPKKKQSSATRRLEVGRKDKRFWPVAGYLLDLLEACKGRLQESASHLGITTSNLASILKQDRHLHAAASQIRQRYRLGPLK